MLNNEFEKLPLAAHEFLAGVPLHSLRRLDLPGGRKGMSILDIKEVLGFDTEKLDIGFFSKILFALRGAIGWVFRWDFDEKLIESVSYLSRLTARQRAESMVDPGKTEGISRVLYCSENEFAAEIINHTVHCFWVMAIEEKADGYAFWMAIYVKKLNWFTPVYMTLVTPMLKGIIYPSMEKSILRNWKKAFPLASGKRIPRAAVVIK